MRIYTSAGAGAFPVIVYYHGSGGVIAGINVIDGGARGLSKKVKGGLPPAARKAFKKNDRSNPKPGVTGAASTLKKCFTKVRSCQYFVLKAKAKVGAQSA